jgi:putative ABC transport system permease protein
MSVLRDIFRRKGRSILTMSGIAVGVFALVVLGAIAENSNVYVSKLVGYYSHAIVVTEENDANWVGMANGNRPLSMQTVEQIGQHAGVDSVSPQVNMLYDVGYLSVIPPMVLGTEPGSKDYESFTLSEGRGLQSGESHTAVLGPDLAKQLKVKLGETIDVRGQEFEVVGLLDRTYVNLLDSSVFVSLADAQNLYVGSLPKTFQATVKPQDLVVQAMVYVKPGVDPDALAAELSREVSGIRATGPAAMMKTVNSLLSLLNVVVGAIAALALLIGALSVVNTMMMSVSERTREIGVKRALGASRSRVAREVLLESAVMAGLGGLGGLAIGAMVAFGLNAAIVAATGTTVFVLTARLAIGAIAFAMFLGAIGGLYPARHASRLDPATALAYQ